MRPVHVFQAPGSKSCLGCVAAMIMGDADLGGVVQFLGHAALLRPYRMTEIITYLAWRGVLVGGFAARPATWKRRIRQRWAKSQDALLIVKDTAGRGNHAVYWTGEEVLDPERGNFGRVLADYEVMEWWPVMRVEHGEL